MGTGEVRLPRRLLGSRTYVLNLIDAEALASKPEALLPLFKIVRTDTGSVLRKNAETQRWERGRRAKDCAPYLALAIRPMRAKAAGTGVRRRLTAIITVPYA